MDVLTEEACFRLITSRYPDLEDATTAEAMAVFARECVEADRERIYQVIFEQGIDAESLIFPEKDDIFADPEHPHRYRNE